MARRRSIRSSSAAASSAEPQSQNRERRAGAERPHRGSFRAAISESPEMIATPDSRALRWYVSQ